jgi:hypothetical protein
VEETHFKPGDTTTAILGKWANLALKSGTDQTGYGRGSHVCLGKGKYKVANVTVFQVGKHSAPGGGVASAQQYHTQYAYESARVDIYPFKQTLIDLEYFILELKSKGYEIAIVIDAKEAEDRNARQQPHTQCFPRQDKLWPH